MIGLLQFWATKNTHYFLNELKVTKNPKNFIIQPIVRESCFLPQGCWRKVKDKAGNETFNRLCLPNSQSVFKIRQSARLTTARELLAGKLTSSVWKLLLISMVHPGWIFASLPKHHCVVFSSRSLSGIHCKNDGSKEASHQEEGSKTVGAREFSTSVNPQLESLRPVRFTFHSAA